MRLGLIWVSTRSLGEVLLRVGLVGAGAKPLGVCPAPGSRINFHAFPRGAPGPYPRAGRGEKEGGGGKDGRKEGGSSALFKTSTQHKEGWEKWIVTHLDLRFIDMQPFERRLHGELLLLALVRQLQVAATADHPI